MYDKNFAQLVCFHLNRFYTNVNYLGALPEAKIYSGCAPGRDGRVFFDFLAHSAPSA